jgi:hypothetical protein
MKINKERFDHTESSFRSGYRILQHNITVFKKCFNEPRSRKGENHYKAVIVELLLTRGTRIYCGFGDWGIGADFLRRKCRASRARVKSITLANSKKRLTKAYSRYRVTTGSITYTVGRTVYPHRFEEQLVQECSGGIHFFFTRKEAKNYNF